MSQAPEIDPQDLLLGLEYEPEKEIWSEKRPAPPFRINVIHNIAEVVEALCLTEFPLGEGWKDLQQSPEYTALYESVLEVSKTFTRARAGFENFPTTEDTSHKDEILGKNATKRYNARYRGGPTLLCRYRTRQVLKDLMDSYERTYPRPSDSRFNRKMAAGIRKYRDLGQFEDLDRKSGKWLLLYLIHRLGRDRLATAFKNYLEIPYPNCQDIDVHAEYKRVQDNGSKAQNMYLMQAYALVNEHVESLFEHAYQKGTRPFEEVTPYLALVLSSTKWNEHKIIDALRKCREYRIMYWKTHRLMSPQCRAKYPDIEIKLLELKRKWLQDCQERSQNKKWFQIGLVSMFKRMLGY